MGFFIDCPNCGPRSYHEYWFGGELRPYDPAADVDDDYASVWLRDNADGPQVERWFHYGGCRRWLTIERDTHDNHVRCRLDLPAATPAAPEAPTEPPAP